MEHLRNLQRLLADGFISPAEYEHRRQQLIDKLTNTTLASPEDEKSNQKEKDRMERRRGRNYYHPLGEYLVDDQQHQHGRVGLRYEPYNPVMALAQKYTLSRKIGQLPEDALPYVLRIVERLSPDNLRQSGDDWTFDLETLEDRTLWKLNDFVNVQIKHHFGEKTNDTSCESHEAGMVEEEKPSSAAAFITESDPEDMEEDRDAGLELNDDVEELASCTAFGRDFWPTKNTEELKAAKRPRLLTFGAGEKRKKKEDIKKRGKERRERERAMAAAKRLHSRERESESDEGDDTLAGPTGPFVRHMEEVMQLEKERDAVDEMEKESESEYEREEYEDPEYTTDTQLKQEDDEDEGSDGDAESDEDWTPVDEKPRRRSGDDTVRDRATAAPVKPEPSVPVPVPALLTENGRDRQVPPQAPPPLSVMAKREGCDGVETTPAMKKEKEKEASAAPAGKPFKIQVCIYSLAKKSNGKKPYVCDACDKAFADRSNLIQHLRVHTKEKPYGCTYEGCEKRFAHSASLKEHLYTHTGDKPHVCSFPGCGMSFAQASNLRRHQLVHTGEKPFACEVAGCKKSFTQKINLAQHLKRVHKIVHSDMNDSAAADDVDEEEAAETKTAVRRPSKRSRSTTSTSSSSLAIRGTSSASKLGSR